MSKLDPITFEVIRSSFYAIAAEMKATVIRSAYSITISMGGDISTTVADPTGRIVALGQDIPAQLGAMSTSLTKTLETYGIERLEDGDVLLSNDPYLAGSNHQNDVAMIMPIFHDNELVAFTVTRAHWTDIGGSTPGNLCASVLDIYNEGQRIPPIRVYKNGELIEDVVNLIMANLRNPQDRVWDLRAQYAGCTVGGKSVKNLFKKYGKDLIFQSYDETINYTERRMRALISKFPDGEYTFEDYIEGDGWRDWPIKIAAKLKIEGSDIYVDFTGSDPQVLGGVNASYAITKGMTNFIIKAVTDHTIPYNVGAERPIHIIAPEGTVVNPTAPTACSGAGNSETSGRICDLLLACLSQAIPDRVIAGSYSSCSTLIFSGKDPNEERRQLLKRDRYITLEPHGGGMGARPTRDGVNGIRVHAGNTMTMTVEFLEFTTPIQIKRWEIIENSGGAGKNRGGNSVVREYELLEDMSVTLTAERSKIPAFGLYGGQAGEVAQFVLNRNTAEERVLPAKTPALPLTKGTNIWLQTAAGGGYGNPYERQIHKIEDDVQNGYITRAHAEQYYGVVFADNQIIDHEASAKNRANRPSPFAEIERGTNLYEQQ